MGTITPKQIAFIERLHDERGIAFDRPAVERLTAREASAAIDAILALPRPERAPLPQADPGYYVTADGDVIVIVRTKDGERTYGKRLVFSVGDAGRKTARWEYERGLQRLLAGLSPLTVEEAARLGHHHGFCVVCAKALTDPASVARGIGPVCVKRLTGARVAA